MSTFRKFWETKPRMDYAERVNDYLSTGDYAAGDFTSTKTGAATEVISVGAGASGVLVLTNSAGASDVSFHQNKIEAWRFQTGKALEFEIRFKLDDATLTDWVAGLQITDTTPLAVSDGVFFRKNAANAIPVFVVCKDGVESVLTLTDYPLVNDTWVKLGFYHDGDRTVDCFINDVRVGALPVTNLPTTVPLDAAELLAVSYGLQNRTAVARTMSIDYIRAVQQR